jgi:hypothetical protein
MGRAFGGNVSKPGQKQAMNKIGVKRQGQLKVFVNTINKELEEIENLIIEATAINVSKNQEKR